MSVPANTRSFWDHPRSRRQPRLGVIALVTYKHTETSRIRRAEGAELIAPNFGVRHFSHSPTTYPNLVQIGRVSSEAQMQVSWRKSQPGNPGSLWPFYRNFRNLGENPVFVERTVRAWKRHHRKAVIYIYINIYIKKPENEWLRKTCSRPSETQKKLVPAPNFHRSIGCNPPFSSKSWVK